MSAGKQTPRQKMINMMYLVLTALLALNVSKEVLDSFFAVNSGIERTTTKFASKNGDTYSAFENAATNNPEKYQAVRDKAYSVKNSVNPIILYIQEMKYNLVIAVDKKIYLGNAKDILDEDGKPNKDKAIKEKKSGENQKFSELNEAEKKMPIVWLSNKDNREQAGLLFYREKRALKNKIQGKPPETATQLKNKILAYRDLLITLADSNQQLIDNINVVCDVSDRGSGKKKQSWEKYNFVDMPSVGALTILSKIQSDLRNIEADVIDYLKRNIDAKSLKFGDAEGVQIPKTNFVIRGDSFKSTIFVAAKQDGQDPEIYVGKYDSLGGEKYEMRGEEGVDYEAVRVVNGKGMFATRTLSLGNQKWGGLIKMKTEKGTQTYPFSGEYLVAPKTVVASPTNMNVLYVAVDNPITVAVAGYSASQVTAITRNGTIKAVNKSKGEWIVNPNKQSNKAIPVIDLSVSVDGKRKPMGSVEFKVKDVPQPIPKAAGISKKVVSKGDLRASQMLIAEMKDFYFDRNAVSYRIVSYDISYVNKKGQFKKTIKGYKFNDKVLEAINNTKVGGSITFSNITAKRKGVKTLRTLDIDVMYTIK